MPRKRIGCGSSHELAAPSLSGSRFASTTGLWSWFSEPLCGFASTITRHPICKNMKSALLPFLILAFATMASAADDLSATPVEKLIDALAEIDSQTLGLHGTAAVFSFIAEDKPPKFGGGVLGSAAPTIPPPMRELARRGLEALPDLINHLDDKRPTKLTIGKDWFMFRCYNDEYDPKTRPKQEQLYSHENLEKNFNGEYTVKVGDVCFSIIGQIVNRNLLPVRYQPTGGLIINSPIESPTLAERVKEDWSGIDIPGHKASLIADAKYGDYSWAFGSALVRLRFYYPNDYKHLKAGDLKKRITEFEADESKQH